MAKKKLLIISGSFCLEAGGIENTSYLLAEYMREYMDVFTFCPVEGKMPNLDGVTSYQGKVSFNNPRKRIGYLRDSYKMINKICKEHHIDYILCPHYTFAFTAYLMKRKFGIPYGVMTHGNEVYKKWPKQKTFFLQVVWFFQEFIKRQLMLNNATQIFSNTLFTKGLVEKVTKNGNVFVINPPIGVEQEELEKATDGHYILSLGRLIERKGYHLVLKALPELLQKRPEIKYVIAGGGEYESHLKQLTKELSLEDNVIFKGRVTEEEKKRLMRNCSLFVLPSYEIPSLQSVEGFGLSLLEANIYGKFVISSKSGGIPEAVDDGKTGILVRENDVESLTKAFLKFFDEDYKYDPSYCVQWAKRCHITNIANQYYKNISKIID